MTVTFPDTVEGLQDLLCDGQKLAALIRDGQFKDAMDAYAEAVMKANGEDLSKQLNAGLQAGLQEWLKANQVQGLPQARIDRAVARQAGARAPSSAMRALYNPRAAGAKAEGVFEDWTEFLAATAVAAGRGPRAQAAGLRGKLAKLTEIMNSYGSEIPESGGFLIPEDMRSQILQIGLEEGMVRPRATTIPMSTLRASIPFVDDTSHVSSILGGVICYWAEESAALTESAASFGKMDLDAKKLTAFAAVPNELLDDAPAFTGFLDSTFPRAVAWFEDIAFLTGTGVGQPQGLINCAASVQVAAEAGQPSATIVWENIVNMYSRMLPTSLMKAVWICSIDCFPQLATMALSVGTGGSAVWVGNTAGESGSDAPPVRILGRPVMFTEKTGPLGTTGDINFVDPSYYVIGDRQQMLTAVSDQYYFANDKTAYRVIERLDGRPWIQSPITPHNGSASTLSPFVQLASR